MKLLTCLPPVIPNNAKVLILGTFPGCESLLQENYYAHGTNSFWKLLFTVFDKPISKNYEERVKLLHDNNIALWDIIASCSREGSSDKKITNPTPNNIPSLLESNPSIKTIIITSGDVQKHLFQYYPNLKAFSHIKVISSSSGTIGISFEEKLEDWRRIKN